MPTTQVSAKAHTRLALRETLVLDRRPGGSSTSLLATQNHSFALQSEDGQKLSAEMVDFNTYAAPEAFVLRNLDSLTRLNG